MKVTNSHRLAHLACAVVDSFRVKVGVILEREKEKKTNNDEKERNKSRRKGKLHKTKQTKTNKIQNNVKCFFSCGSSLLTFDLLSC